MSIKGGKKHSTYNKPKKAKWIGHILHRNCLLNHIIKGKMERRDKKTRMKMYAATE